MKRFLQRSVVGAALVAGIWSIAQAAPITSGTGPGGVGFTNGASSLALWLRSDQGVFQDIGGTTAATLSAHPVARWNDLSGFGRNATQSTVADQPSFQTAIVNGQPVIRMSSAGVGDSLNTSNFGLAHSTGSPVHVFSTFRWDGTGTGNATIFDGSGTNTMRLYANAGGPMTMYSGGGLGVNLGGAATQFHNHAMLFGGSGSRYDVDGGVFSNTGSLGSGSPGQVRVGGITGSEYAGVDFSEYAIFSTAVNSAQRRIIENYLSARSGVALMVGTDIYAGDNPGNGNYDFNVFGVGQISGASHPNSGTAGLGIEATGGLADGEFVMAGNRNVANGLTAAEGLAPYDRWNQVWFIDATGNVDITLAFDASDAGGTFPYAPELLFSPTGAFSWTSLGFGTLAGDLVSFNLANFGQDGYYTLGFVQPLVPEPATIGLFGLALATVLGVEIRRRRR